MHLPQAFAALLAACALSAQAAEPLPRLNILPGSLTVSGVSAGGYMAVQYQVAYSKDVIGAGIIAAGPWYCARGSLVRALGDCMGGSPAGPEIVPLIDELRRAAADKRVDDPSWLAPDRVWVLHGANDRTIGAAVTDALVRFYRSFLPPERIAYETQLPAAHGFPTRSEGGPCGEAASPWLNDCDYDAAGELLGHLYGALAPRGDPDSGRLLDFGQARHAGDAASSLDEAGFVYVPADCAAGRPCRLHIAFHGCRQGADFTGRAFARRAGYNAWAASNRIVVLYPQVARSWLFPFNPQGCWDWWGYTGDGYAWRTAPQLLAIRRMAVALGAR